MTSAADSGLPTAMHYLFCWLVSFVSIFAPREIGVFELVFTELANFDLLRKQAVVFVASLGVLVMLSDILTWLGFILARVARRVGEKQEA